MLRTMTPARPLVRSSLRYIARHPLQIGLSVLGIALGVAIAVGMDLAIGSARQAFELSAEAVAGRATHQVVGADGRVDTETYRRLRVELGLREAAPVIEDDVEIEEAPGRVFRLLGVDPFADAAIRPFVGGVEGDLTGLLTEPSAWMTAAVAAEIGAAIGDTLRLRVEGRGTPVRLVALIEPEDGLEGRALRSVLVTDVATAQAVLRTDGLTRIDLRLPDAPDVDGEAGAALASIRQALAPGERIVAAGTRSDALLQMTRAFRINLTALSLLAVLFGVFFIYNAMTFSVVQRRPLFGTMRALGVTRGQLLEVILLEALLLGAIGGAIGIGVGVALGRGLVGLVTTTINDLYFAVTVRELAIPPLAFVKGAALAVGGSVLGALPPALEAVRTRPGAALLRSDLEARVRRAVPRLALGGAGMLLVGGLLLVPRGRLVLGFAGLFAVVVGCTLLVPLAVTLIMRAVRPVASLFGPLGRLAASGVTTALSRTAPALAALMVAVATTVALGVMIGSFRASVVSWLDATLQADVYVSVPGLVSSRPGGAIDPELIRSVRAAPGVEAVASYRIVELVRGGAPLRVGVLEPAGERSREGYRFAAGDPASAWAAFVEGDALVSEPLAYRERLAPGDTIVLPTPRGNHPVRVAGVVYDYAPGEGVVILHRTTYDDLFDDPGVSSLAVHAAQGVEADALVRTLGRLAAGAEQALVIRENRALRQASLDVFDRTFLITGVLRVLAFVVAFVGVLAALAALQLERAREFGVLRATGVTPGQLRGLVTAQTGLMGLAAGLLAVPVGALLAALMIHVINRRSFGWSLDMDFPLEVVVQAIGLAVGAALLAGIVPAHRMAKSSPALALREE
jgi:putative ABC transport system permease protein